MKRFLAVLIFLTVLNTAAAQTEFFGVGTKAELGPSASTYFDTDDVFEFFPPDTLMLEVQAGDYALFGPIGFRQVVGIAPDYVAVGGDLLVPLTEGPRLYLGAGAHFTAGDGTVLTLRAVAGAEVMLSRYLGLYGEFNPGYYIARDKGSFEGTFDDEDHGFQVRLGFNVHP